MSNSCAAPVANISIDFSTIGSRGTSPRREDAMKMFDKCFTVMALVAVLATNQAAFAQPQPAKPIQQIDIIRIDPRFDKLVPINVKVERIVGGRTWVEGPVWNRKENYLLFSDIPTNSVIKWQEGKGTSVFLKPSGYTGKTPFEGAEPGSNGLTFDSDGRLVLAEHGDRRVGRLEKNGKKTNRDPKRSVRQNRRDARDEARRNRARDPPCRRHESQNSVYFPTPKRPGRHQPNRARSN